MLAVFRSLHNRRTTGRTPRNARSFSSASVSSWRIGSDIAIDTDSPRRAVIASRITAFASGCADTLFCGSSVTTVAAAPSCPGRAGQ
jgi:hypothetical protein